MTTETEKFILFMNYQHAYHAGNFADVFKHIILVLLIEALQQKEKPFCYLDTHAGAGCYDLWGEAVQKTGEYRDGIAILAELKDIPDSLQLYLNIIKKFNPDDSLRYYPGSPVIVQQLLRLQDKMILCEIVPHVYQELRHFFTYDSRVAVHQQDAFLALKAFLPPQQKRGLVLIDPPYEIEGEFEQVTKGLKLAWQRWPQAIYAAWYPLTKRASIIQFHQQLKLTQIKPILLIELSILANDAPAGLSGCGMIIINPPWQFEEKIKTLLPWLWHVLSKAGAGSSRVEWLVAE